MNEPNITAPHTAMYDEASEKRIAQLQQELDQLKRISRARRAMQEEELRRIRNDNRRLKSQLEVNHRELKEIEITETPSLEPSPQKLPKRSHRKSGGLFGRLKDA